jgi:hypothetical protein
MKQYILFNELHQIFIKQDYEYSYIVFDTVN